MKILTKQEADQFLKQNGKVTDITVSIDSWDGPSVWFFTDDHSSKHELQKHFYSWIPITMYFRHVPVPHVKPRPGIGDGMITNIDKWMIAFGGPDAGAHIQSEQELRDFLKLNQTK